uniref:Zb protein n=1 Tax=Hericium erinaceus TaxID=91752 RepID=Q7ZA64_HERER|nr:Zb protein [Hericium erinaceus]
MPQVKTSWEDLANLGWPIQQVYEKANAARGGSMEGKGDLSLNNGVAAEYQWWCYNSTRGDPIPSGTIPDTIRTTETVWSYDNSQNLQPFTTSWTESWTESSSATLSITNHASLQLSQSITIPGVGGSSFEISISTESTDSKTKSKEHTLTNTWDLTVGPREIVSIERTETKTTGTTMYAVPYGTTDESMLGTKGKKWNDHYYWGMYVNPLLNYPTGRMELQGYSEKTSFTHKIARTGPDGKKTTEPAPLTVKMVKEENGEKSVVAHMVPGPE